MHTNNIWITEYQQILIKKCSETTGKGKLLCGYSLILLKYVRFQKHFILFMFIFFANFLITHINAPECTWLPLNWHLTQTSRWTNKLRQSAQADRQLIWHKISNLSLFNKMAVSQKQMKCSTHFDVTETSV